MSLSLPSSPEVADITNGLSETHLNGSTSDKHEHADDAALDTVDALRAELGRVRAEKDTLAGQYGNLVQKLNAMRTSVANKLQQDAEELDRREQLASSLNAENEELQATIETLKSELVVANDEAARAESELDAYRAQARASEGAEGALHEAHAELERARIERDEWARLSEQERALRESARDAADGLRRELENEREARVRIHSDFEAERERAVNLQSVLEDFQAAKAHEIRQAVTDYETRLEQTTLSLAEFKHRAHIAEMKLEESSTDITKTAELEKTAKEKDALVTKLRHEAVILNDHLNEALRRLRRTAMDRDTAVDRRLVTNILLSFLNAPRGDAKRFEMLKVLSDILGWGETEREKAGLQRAGGISRAPSKAGTDGLEKTDETESFSQMWVEFLLTQAEGAEGGSLPPPSPTRSTAMSSPASPRRSLASLTPTPSPMAEPRKSGSWIRLPSFGGSVTTREDTASPPPIARSAKGKEKEVS